MTQGKNKIIIKGAREHNLKNISLEIPRNKLVVFTGVSGSGKSSLVFDTIYAEGQRRYVESLSSYVRQFLERMNKPDVDFIYGISPAVAIEQKRPTKNPRSTVGTSTEIYDYLRLLFARIGKTVCFNCGNYVTKDSVKTVTDWLEEQSEDEKFLLAFPLHKHSGRETSEELELLKKKGFFRIYANGKLTDLHEAEDYPTEKENIYVVVERFKIRKGEIRNRLADSIEMTFKEGEGRLAVINPETGTVKNFSQAFECCGIKYVEPEPLFFSFNNPYGACPVCQGFGRVMDYDINLIIPNQNLSISEGAIAPFRTTKYSRNLQKVIHFARKENIPLNIPFKDLTQAQKDLLCYGKDNYEGIYGFFKALEKKTYKIHVRVLLSKYRGYTTCSACKGSRLRREALQVKIAGRSIHDVVRMSIEEANKFFKKLKLSEYEQKIGGRILKEIKKRLKYLNEVGLGYLTLDRLSSTLSGGEMQRINLATFLGSSLIGTLYILDEPTIGLHPRDNSRLIKILKSLRDLGNTVLVVEHDAEMMKEADLIFDMGPFAGEKGGEIIASGSFEEIKENPSSLTGQYLSGKKEIPFPRERNLKKTNSIIVHGATENNLKNITVEFPLNKFVVVTGVSGSGKSTLVNDVLYNGLFKKLGGFPHYIGAHRDITGFNFIDHVEIVDQSPIGKSPRSNPISYVKGFEQIRQLFASLPHAKARRYTPGYFSFNVPGGRCETCKGEGFIKIEMQFLADVYLTCEDCKGTRYKEEVREITYRGKNIVDVLNMTVNEAIELFHDHTKIMKYLTALRDVGLGYIKLGQPSNTLSGGEAQRIKLAQHLLADRPRQRTLFIFDEPTTGLHFDDIKKLLTAFRTLLRNNNSLVIIEHNLDVIKNADYIIDLGPGAGDKGGKVLFAGTPEELVKCKRSHTAKYLKPILAEADKISKAN